LRTRHGAIRRGEVHWVLEADIVSFFDKIDVRLLRGILDQRVNDGVMRRVIHKWLKAGVMEDGVLRRPKAGTPQGGVISPLLANVYLHEVLDMWFAREVQRRLRGRSFLVRYADDAVLVFEHREDAERVLQVLPKRFAKYGLRLHPEKTRLVCFRRPARQGPNGHGPNDPPMRFDLLGFTHVWGTSRKGRRVVKQRTARSRLTRALERIRLWCRIHRHQPVAEQHEALCRKLRGHYGYYGITGNIPALSRFWGEVRKIWHKWLNRRSGRKHMRWPRYEQLLVRYPLPRPRIVQSALARSAKP
jgi:group II intron reverse transcriptase/maturase